MDDSLTLTGPDLNGSVSDERLKEYQEMVEKFLGTPKWGYIDLRTPHFARELPRLNRPYRVKKEDLP